MCVLSNQAEDLRLLMQKMENWAHRLYPKLQFEEFIDRVEKLGKKKEVQVGRSYPFQRRVLYFLQCSICNYWLFFLLQTCLKRIRLDMPLTHEDYTSKDGKRQNHISCLLHGETCCIQS